MGSADPHAVANADRLGSARVAFLVLVVVIVGVAALLQFGAPGGSGAQPAPGVAVDADERVRPRASTDAVDVPNDGGSGSRSAAPDVAGATEVLDPEDTRAWSVEVDVRSGPRPDDAAVPDVDVVLAHGPCGAWPDLATLATARTGADGRARLELPWRRVTARHVQAGLGEWVVGLRTPGWQMRGTIVRVPTEPTTSAARLIARRGGTVVGRVLDAAGAQVPARVSASLAGDPGRIVAGAVARETGRFELHLLEAMPHDLTAEAGEHGTAVAHAQPIEFTDPPGEIRLLVRGDGRLRGTVRDEHGGPAAGVRLEFRLIDVADPGGAAAWVGAGARRADLAANGRRLAECTTGVDGSFDVAGLRVARYSVHALPRRMTGGPVDLHPGGVVADGSLVDLVLTRPHVVVRIVDALGAPWTGTRALALGRDVDDVVWPRTPEVSLAREVPDVAFGRHDVFLHGAEAPGGECVFEVEPGASYRASLTGGDLAPASARVEVPPGSGRVEVVLVAEPCARGRIELDLVDAQGERVTGGYALRVEDPRDGRVVLEAQPGPSGFSGPLEVPVGRWRLTVDGLPRLDSWHGVLWSSRSRGRAEALVDVVAGGTHRILMRIGAGGRLRVKLVGAPSDSDERAVARMLGPMWVSDDWPEQRARRAALRLVSDARPIVPVSFVEVWEGSSAAGPHLVELLELGHEDTSQLLPAGSFVLEAVLPGGRTARAPVELVDGGTTAVVLTFD